MKYHSPLTSFNDLTQPSITLLQVQKTLQGRDIYYHNETKPHHSSYHAAAKLSNSLQRAHWTGEQISYLAHRWSQLLSKAYWAIEHVCCEIQSIYNYLSSLSNTHHQFLFKAKDKLAIVHPSRLINVPFPSCASSLIVEHRVLQVATSLFCFGDLR